LIKSGLDPPRRKPRRNGRSPKDSWKETDKMVIGAISTRAVNPIQNEINEANWKLTNCLTFLNRVRARDELGGERERFFKNTMSLAIFFLVY